MQQHPPAVLLTFSQMLRHLQVLLRVCNTEKENKDALRLWVAGEVVGSPFGGEVAG